MIQKLRHRSKSLAAFWAPWHDYATATFRHRWTCVNEGGKIVKVQFFLDRLK
jgi:hypothetical protein